MKKSTWISCVLALGALDVAMDRRQGVTLSQTAREVFCTRTRPGKAIFAGAWLGLSVWLIPHIWTWAEEVVESDGAAR